MGYGRLFFVIIFALMAATGCDWVRGKMGMETSEDIIAAKLALERKAVEVHIKDSLERVYRDSLISSKAEEPVIDAGDMINNGDNYHLVVGSFLHYDNATGLVELLKRDGYGEAFWFDHSNGFRSVSAESYPTIQEAYNKMYEVLYSGKYINIIHEIWIYKRNR